MEMSQKTNIKYNNVLLYYGLYTIIPNSSQNIIYSMVKLLNANAKSLYNMVLYSKSGYYLVNIQIQIQISYNRLQNKGSISLSLSPNKSQSQSHETRINGLCVLNYHLPNNNINIITTNHD